MPNSNKKKIDDLNSRFIEVMERLGHSGYSLSKELGTSEAVISNIRTGKNPPNVLLIQALLNKYVEVDPGWLLSGNGRMFRRSTERAATVGDGRPSRGSADQRGAGSIEERLGRIESLLERSIAGQLERNLLTDESIADLGTQVERMESEIQSLRKVPRRTGSPRS